MTKRQLKKHRHEANYIAKSLCIEELTRTAASSSSPPLDDDDDDDREEETEAAAGCGAVDGAWRGSTRKVQASSFKAM